MDRYTPVVDAPPPDDALLLAILAGAASVYLLVTLVPWRKFMRWLGYGL